MSNESSSPGVYTNEYDESQLAVTPSTSTGVIVGEFIEGPVGERTLITSESQLIATFGKPDVSLGYACHSALAYLGEGDQLYVTRVAPNALYGGLTIGWDGRFNTSESWSAGLAEPALVPFAASSLFAVYAINPGDWNGDMYLRIYPDTADTTSGAYFYVEVYMKNTALPVEKHRVSLQYVLDGFGTQRNIAEYINRNSNYIQVVQNYAQADFVATPLKKFINTYDAGGDATKLGITVAGGQNGARPTVSDLINAWSLYEDPEVIDISILINSGYTNVDYQLAMIELCESRKDCVAILDAPSDQQEASKAIAFRRSTLQTDTTYAALYAPDVLVADKYNDRRLYLPISGFVAAVYALTDRDYTYYFAPAGMTRGDLSVAGVRQVYDQGMRDALYSSQVNAVRVFSGGGIKVWGADTLQVVASSLSNMSVRRLMITIEKSLSEVMLYAVFDPNDVILRSRLESQANRFLQPIMDARGLYYFKVVCDDTNNPDSVVAAGDLNVDIYVDPTLPVKRIHFTAVVNATGVRVTASNL